MVPSSWSILAAVTTASDAPNSEIALQAVSAVFVLCVQNISAAGQREVQLPHWCKGCRNPFAYRTRYVFERDVCVLLMSCTVTTRVPRYYCRAFWGPGPNLTPRLGYLYRGTSECQLRLLSSRDTQSSQIISSSKMRVG